MMFFSKVKTNIESKLQLLWWFKTEIVFRALMSDSATNGTRSENVPNSIDDDIDSDDFDND
jgi:hypothetical protein